MISMSLPSSVFGFKYLKNKQIELPEDWHQVKKILDSNPKLAFVFATQIIQGDNITAICAVIKALMGETYFDHAGIPELDQLVKKMKFVGYETPPSFCLKSSIIVAGKKYICPLPDMENVTLREYDMADQILKEFGESSNVDLLYKLTACFYRPQNNNKKEAHHRNDERIQLVGENQINHTAAIFKRHHGAILFEKKVTMLLASSLLFVLHCKQNVYQSYGIHLMGNTETDTETSGGFDFGWFNVATDIAESGVFGDINAVYDTPIHDLCIYMLKKKQDADKYEQLSQANREK